MCRLCTHITVRRYFPPRLALQRKCSSKLLAPSKFRPTPPWGHYFRLCGVFALSPATGNVRGPVQSEQLKVLFHSIQTGASLCALTEELSHLVDALSQLKA